MTSAAELAQTAGITLGVVVAVLAVTALWSRAAGRVSVVDVAWGLGFVAVALTCAAVGDGDQARRWLLAALVAVWGGRLAWHIHRRSRGPSPAAGEDPRYAELIGKGGVAVVIR